MKQLRCKILSNYHLSSLYYKISISSNYIAKIAKPGQFVHIKCSDNNTPLLRRPFSIHSVSKEKNTLKILYEVLGKGTEFLSEKKAGDFLDVIGPLGNGFNYQLSRMQLPKGVTLRDPEVTPRQLLHSGPITSHQSPVLVAGGMGVAPLLFLAKELTTHYSLLTTVLIGARTKDLILCKDEFKKLGCDVKIATDDGSLGFKGKVTDLLKSLLSVAMCNLPFAIFACGPSAMLKEVSKIAKQHRINCQVSLEEIIACGVGVCLGCAVSTKGGYKLVCKDGPVFNADEIVW